MAAVSSLQVRSCFACPMPIGLFRCGSTRKDYRSIQGYEVKIISTKPIDGQKTGTSGLRKKTNIFMGEHYLANW